MSVGPCMCGATDCRSCGPAQGYDVVNVWRNGRARFINPDDMEAGDVPDEDMQAAADEHAWNERKEAA